MKAAIIGFIAGLLTFSCVMAATHTACVVSKADLDKGVDKSIDYSQYNW